jgi:hypothetical protein
VTVSGNQAETGGGVWNGGQAEASFTTIAANDVLSGGGGIRTTGTFTIGSVLLADNESDNGLGDDCLGALVSLGHNVVRDSDNCDLTSLGPDQIDTNAYLLPLALVNNTWVHNLFFLSPALNEGDPDECTATDQAGQDRPIGAGCESGAYETPGYAPYQLFLALVLK